MLIDVLLFALICLSYYLNRKEINEIKSRISRLGRR